MDRSADHLPGYQLMRRAPIPLPVRLLLVALLVLPAGHSLSRPIVTASPLSPTPGSVLQQGVRAVSAITRSRYVAVSLDRMPTPETRAGVSADGRAPIRLDLFDDVSVDLEFERFEVNRRGTTWIGRVAGRPASHVTLVYGDGLMTGSVVMDDATYAIRPAPADARATDAGTAGLLHVVSEIDQSGFRREAEPIEPVQPSPARREAAADSDGYVDPSDVIDLLVVYTPGAVAYAGGTAALHDLVALGVAETNASYGASGVVQRLRLVQVAEVAHAEHLDSAQTLDDLQAGTGAFAGVAALRNTWAADLVMLIQFSGAPVCGIAYMMNWPSLAFESSAFSLVEADCVSPNYTFAHELGHNMGLRHDWYVDSGTWPYTHAHGHVSTAEDNRWRTIMSYGDLCVATGAGCPRLLAWSNPAVLHNGAPMGIAEGTKSDCTTGSLSANTCDADDAQALNQTAVHVANFRHAVPGPFATATPVTGQIVHPGSLVIAWTSAFRANDYEYCYDTVANNTCDTGWIPVGDATNALIVDLAPATSYQWQVRAVNDAGWVEAGGGVWSSFHTGPAPGADFARNGGFDAGLDDWLSYATPDMSYVVANAAAGALEFYRVAPGDGTPNQAVVFQQTGTPLVAGTAVELQVEFGNSDTVWKRISVLLHDADFSDLAVCTFWLPPEAPLAGYTMRAHTTQPWTDTGISFYAASSGSHGGFYQIDNVSVRYAPALPATRTDCVDPFASEPGIGADSVNLIANGAFSGDSLASWDTWGTIDQEVVAGVVQFVRPTADAPSGVLLQRTDAPMAAGDILTAAFQLGNTSTVRKRVTAVLHDSDFSDLSACTFWLPPGQPLAPYVYRTYATRPWTNATLSIYPATIGADEWILFDNATLRRTPGATILGTECVEPDAWPDRQSTDGGSDVRTLAGAWVASAATGSGVPDGWNTDGFTWSADGTTWVADLSEADAARWLEWATPLDLRNATSARLSFTSQLEITGARAAVEVSVDGLVWTPGAEIPTSNAPIPVNVDLSTYVGTSVLVRFVLDPLIPPASGRWRIGDLRVTLGD